MPAGISWPKYIKFVVAASLSMFAGAQTVHYFYKPLDDLNDLVAEEMKRKQKKT